MTIKEKIKAYVSKRGQVMGCKLPNKTFWYKGRFIKLNSCAQVIAREMVRNGELSNNYIKKEGKGRYSLVVYSLGV